MTLDEAIKNLTAGREDFYMIPPHEYTPTIDLAIEALRRLKAQRLHGFPLMTGTLPHETKD